MRKIIHEFDGTKHQNGQALKLVGFVHETDATSLQTQWPVLFFIPGGSLTHIEPPINEAVILDFYNRGFSTFYLDYRFLADQQPLMPAPLIDLAHGLSWLHANQSDLQLDPDKFALMGFSIGGLLATLLADLPNHPEQLSAFQLDPTQIKTQALILGYPVTDLTASWPNDQVTLQAITDCPDAYNALKWLTPNHPPTFVWNTATDGAVATQDTLAYVSALQQRHIPVEYHLFATGPHGMALATKQTARKSTQIDYHVASWTTLLMACFDKLWPDTF